MMSTITEEYSMERSPGLTRRHFLLSSAATTLAVPLIVPGSVLGKEGKAPPSEHHRGLHWLW